MVIEYAGTVIRSVLTDKREKFYDGKVSPSPAPSVHASPSMCGRSYNQSFEKTRVDFC